jgi:hypothetical protein
MGRDALSIRQSEKETAMYRPKEFLAWAADTFGPIALKRSERLLRFIEEAVELAHADGMKRADLERLIERVYSRAPGHVCREIGQAQACLETYAEAIGASADEQAAKEFDRVRTIPKSEWTKRHAAKIAVGIAH